VKLSDEKVAEALGWKSLAPRSKGKLEVYWQRSPALLIRGKISGTDEHFGPPAFTTSLDAIVAEIKARGLLFAVANQGGSPNKFHAKVGKRSGEPTHEYDASAPLALCAALLQFLKESNRG